MTRLQELIESGDVYVDNGEYVGLTTRIERPFYDPEIVLGLVGDEDGINTYFESHPNPEDW